MTEQQNEIILSSHELSLQDYERLVQTAGACPSGRSILGVCLGLARFLVAKNVAYGNSALDPVRIFARGLPDDAQLRVRIDDKLSRLARGVAVDEDVLLDLTGYLILMLVQREREGNQDHDERTKASADGACDRPASIAVSNVPSAVR